MFYEKVLLVIYLFTYLSFFACLISCGIKYISTKSVPLKLKYSTLSLLGLSLHLLNLGFFRMVFLIPIILFGIAFLLINNYCCHYFTTPIKILNRILYALYILQGIILPDTNIRGFNYVLFGIISYQSQALEQGQEPTFHYLFTEGLITFFYYFAAILLAVTLVLLIVQFFLCKKQKRLQQNN